MVAVASVLGAPGLRGDRAALTTTLSVSKSNHVVRSTPRLMATSSGWAPPRLKPYMMIGESLVINKGIEGPTRGYQHCNVGQM